MLLYQSANRHRKLLTSLSLAAAACAYAGCASAPDLQTESIDRAASAMTGTVSFDTSCTTAPSPQTVPPVDPTTVMTHLQIAEAYARIVANSPAFAECMQTFVTTASTLGVTNSDVWGPYVPCKGDPSPSTAGAVINAALSGDGTLLSCDYSAIGTSRGGEATIGNIDAQGREKIAFGNQLGAFAAPANCNFNPDGQACVDDNGYLSAANTIIHEVMHTHGYRHVSDAVWGLNNVNIGDVIQDSGYALTLDDFCGVAPAPTPGNGGLAPKAKTSTPTPGVHPNYNTSAPYAAGACVSNVLAKSMAAGNLHGSCGSSYAGLKLVDSIFAGTPGATISHCVNDPYSGQGAAPIPPDAPDCAAQRSATTGPLTLVCNPNTNPIQLERRASSSDTWVPYASNVLDGNFEYRVCAVSLYGKACSTPTVPVATAVCGGDPTLKYCIGVGCIPKTAVCHPKQTHVPG